MARKPLSFYKAAWTAIRKDVSFQIDMRKDLSPAQKSMITRYHNEIRKQTGFRPTYRYTSKSPQRLDAVKKYTGQEPGFPGLKAAYIPIPNGSGKPKVSVSKSGKVKVTTNSGGAGEIDRVGYLFENYERKDGNGDTVTVLTDPDKIVKAILKDDNGKSTEFKMMCGANESSESVSKKFVDETVRRYLDEYDNAEKWFFGIIGYSFQGQASFDDYLKRRKEKPRAKKKNTRRNRRGN